MRIVSIHAVVLAALLTSAPAFAADGDQPSADGKAAAKREPNMVENVDKGADLPTTMGLGNDVHFARPRQFRTDSFNSDHVDVEPLAADPPDSATPEP